MNDLYLFPKYNVNKKVSILLTTGLGLLQPWSKECFFLPDLGRMKTYVAGEMRMEKEKSNLI